MLMRRPSISFLRTNTADAAKGKQSFELEFASVADRDQARGVLTEANIRFRTGKALVPFRISGNASWGIPCPKIDGVSGLTIWCWPGKPLGAAFLHHGAQRRTRVITRALA